MKNCTCNKLNCDSECLCACHRDSETIETLTKDLCDGLDRIYEAVEDCINKLEQIKEGGRHESQRFKTYS